MTRGTDITFVIPSRREARRRYLAMLSRGRDEGAKAGPRNTDKVLGKSPRRAPRTAAAGKRKSVLDVQREQKSNARARGRKR